MKNAPLALSFQLVIGPDKRLHAELEIVMEDGSLVSKTLPANERVTIHFEDLAASDPPKAA